MFDYTRNRAGVPLNSSFSEFILTKKYRVSILLLWHDFRSAISKWINHSREYTWLAENSMIVIVTTAIDGCPALVKHPRRDFSCINARWFALGTCTNFAHRPVAQRTHGGRSFVYMTWHCAAWNVHFNSVCNNNNCNNNIYANKHKLSTKIAIECAICHDKWSGTNAVLSIVFICPPEVSGLAKPTHTHTHTIEQSRLRFSLFAFYE